MSEHEWDQLFDLIRQAINMPYLTADEKGEKIREEASARSAEGNLDEFLAQCGE